MTAIFRHLNDHYVLFLQLDGDISGYQSLKYSEVERRGRTHGGHQWLTVLHPSPLARTDKRYWELRGLDTNSIFFLFPFCKKVTPHGRKTFGFFLAPPSISLVSVSNPWLTSCFASGTLQTYMGIVRWLRVCCKRTFYGDPQLWKFNRIELS